MTVIPERSIRSRPQITAIDDEYFELFLLKKIEQGRAKKTIRVTGGYLWALGGELIRQIIVCLNF